MTGDIEIRYPRRLTDAGNLVERLRRRDLDEMSAATVDSACRRLDDAEKRLDLPRPIPSQQWPEIDRLLSEAENLLTTLDRATDLG
jgi:hypothetical protein